MSKELEEGIRGHSQGSDLEVTLLKSNHAHHQSIPNSPVRPNERDRRLGLSRVREKANRSVPNVGERFGNLLNSPVPANMTCYAGTDCQCNQE